MNLMRLNIWRKLIIVAYLLSMVAMFGIDWGYNYHIGHVVRLGIGAAVFWIVADRL